jgi:Protein of unknown function (DUF1344)
MRTLVVPAIFVALLAMGSLAQAAQHAKGSVESIDPSAKTLTLSDGKTYSLGEHVNATKLSVGEKVKVAYNAADGVNTATGVKKIQ